MTALFFHTAAEPLFGQYGAPSSHSDRDEGVLLCAPVAHEYMRTHWGLRLLAAELQQAGYHVFRFDYSCLGDSWGRFEEATVGRWVADIQAALQELADNAGVDRLSAVGVRLGATLACVASRAMPLHHLILWDPVMEGRRYVEQLRHMQAQLRRDWPTAPACTPGAAFEDLLGYRHSADLIEQLNGLNLNAEPLPQSERVSLLGSDADANTQAMYERRAKNGLATGWRVSKEAVAWDDAAAFTEPILAAEARRSILDLLGGAGP